jgi:hypothetical protein
MSGLGGYVLAVKHTPAEFPCQLSCTNAGTPYAFRKEFIRKTQDILNFTVSGAS